jgi:hypothetical protein
MSVFVGIINGQLSVSGAADNANHTITLDHSGPNNGSGTTFVQVDNGHFQSFPDASITGGIHIDDGDGNGTINIRATVKPTFFEGQSGADIVTLGKGGNMQAIQAPVTMTHSGSLGGIDLRLDDSNDPVARNVTMGVSNGFGSVTGLAPATISYKASDVENVTVNGGSGGNTFNVADTVVNNRPDVGTILEGGSGGDTVNVLGTTGPLEIDPHGVLGQDLVKFGNAGNARGVVGAVSVSTNANQSVALEVDDSADTAPREVTVTGDTIENLATATISYAGAATFQLKLDGGAGGDTFNVQGMPQALTVNGGRGNDTLNVGSITDSLDGLSGGLQFVGGGGTNALNVNDQGTSTPQTYVIGSASIERESGPLSISFDSGVKNITVNGSSGGNSFVVSDTNPTAVTTLNTGLGNDTVEVDSTSGALNVNGQDGFDTVKVGVNGSAQGIKGALTVTNAGDFSALNVDDHLDHTARVVTMNVVNRLGTITGLAPATITYTDGDVSSVTVSGGSGGNTFIVENTASINSAPVTTLNSGIGKDFVTVHGTSGDLVVNGQDGSDLVDVGLNGSVQSIFGALTVTNAASFSTLVLDNSADTVNRVVNMSVADGFGSIMGLAPATISYLATQVNQVQVLGGNGSNKYTINDTVSNSSNPTTIIRGGTRNDTFNLLGSTGTLQVDGGGGTDVINVGGTSLGAASVKGTLGLGDTGGKIRLEVFDGGNRASDTVQVTDHSVIGLAGQIEFNPTQLTSATLRLDGAPDNVFVSSTPAGAPITIVDGGNIDVIRVGSAANTLDGIQGPLTVDGSISGFNTLIINDQGSKTPHTYKQTATTLSRSGAATISFFNVESLAVNKGVVSGSVPAAQGLTLTKSIKAGHPATLSGHLVDAVGDANLMLTVDWGDGSTPDVSVPGSKPFRRTHRFAAPGTDTVRVIWTDTRTGESNFRDLRLTVTAATPSSAPNGHSGGRGFAVPRR